jgi:hypothetical protein
VATILEAWLIDNNDSLIREGPSTRPWPGESLKTSAWIGAWLAELQWEREGEYEQITVGHQPTEV